MNLYYPAKPYNVTQAFGIKNPSYEQFGFSLHNGIDFAVDTDGIVNAMCDGEVYEVGFNSGAGNFVRYKTEPVTLTLPTPDGPKTITAPVGFMYMHAAKQLVTVGQKIKAGDELIVADNTGFSTGPHTHISAYMIAPDGLKYPLNPASNDCFDFSPYYNGKYASDILEPLKLQLTLLTRLVALWQKLSTL